MPDPSPDQHSTSAPAAPLAHTGEPALFAAKTPQNAPAPVTAWLIAGLAVLLLVGGLFLFSRHAPQGPAVGSTPLPPAPAAASLVIPGPSVVMSESTSLSGGKSTYIDGHIVNHGQQTVTAITAQVLFANDAGSAPQVEPTPLTLIRTHQPYVDVEPISAEPLKPGDDREFRLIFEGISPSWNHQTPEIRLVQVTTR